MVATVLIGKESEGAGVASRVFNLGDEGDAEAAHQLGAREVRQRLGSDWPLLSSPVVPKPGDEMAFKLSRHTVAATGQRWTWLGCYRPAQFYDNPRSGTYIGCGMLAREARFEAEPALKYLLAVLKLLASHTIADGTVSRPVFEVAENEVGIRRDGLRHLCSPLAGGGLSASAERRLYVDLSGLKDKAEFNSALIDFVNRAQSEPAFAFFHEVMLGNAGRMAKAATLSQAYQVFTPDQWRSGPGATATPARPPPPPAELAADRMAPAAVRPTSAHRDREVLNHIRDDISRLEAKVDTIQQAVSPNPPAARSASRGVRVPLNLLEYGFLGCIAIACAPLLWFTVSPWLSSTAALPDTGRSSRPAEPAPAEDFNGDDCRPSSHAEVGDGNLIAAMSNEKGCLQVEIGRRTDRVRQIDVELADQPESHTQRRHDGPGLAPPGR